jgi:hypothetical protein
VFCEGVQQCLWFCLDHLNCVKMAASPFYLHSGKQRKAAGGPVRRVGLVGDDTRVVFGKKNSLVNKEVWDDAFEWFNGQFFCRRSSGRNRRTFSSSRRKLSQQHAELTVWPSRTNYIWTIPLMSKKMMNMLLTLLFSCIAFFVLPWTQHAIQTNVYGSNFLPELLSNHCRSLHYTLSEICTKFDGFPLSDLTRYHMRPDTRLQIKRREKLAHPTSCVKCTLTPKIC